MQEREFLFDVKMFAAVRVMAVDEAHARALMREHLECAEANLGAWPSGDPILAEVSADDDHPDLLEIDGETV